MANIKSQIKRNRQNERARTRNRAVRSELRTSLRSAEEALGTDEAEEAVGRAVKRIDKAAQKGVIHRNAAARQKSRLMRKLNAQGA
ncbi:MAG: 30S ribosomal protein S20 [Microthrixaceae bacterium]|nr:30S ribosomal protein S20 [Microthrixaceae bacterium]